MLLCKVYFRLEIERAALGWHILLEKLLEALAGMIKQSELRMGWRAINSQEPLKEEATYL